VGTKPKGKIDGFEGSVKNVEIDGEKLSGAGSETRIVTGLAF